MDGNQARLGAGLALLMAGAAAVAVALAGYASGAAWQWRQHGESFAAPETVPGSHSSHPRPGDPLARMRIPRIGLDLTVIEGTRPADLLKAPGHLAGTALPGDPGDCVIAGHRDIHFRHLGRLRPGDTIHLETRGRESEYRVERTRIVEPAEESALGSSPEPLLTLVTCYPFHYVGPAPRRYLVLARLVRPSGSGATR